MTLNVLGAFPCPDCGQPITTQRVRGRVTRLCEADPYEPYKPHLCVRPPAGAADLVRATASLEAAVAHMDGVWRERERKTHVEKPAARPAAGPAGAAAGPRPAHLRAVPRADSPPPPAARPVAGNRPGPAKPADGAGAHSGWDIER